MSDPLPPLNALRVFKVIGETGGIRLAAELLNISQSAVSRHLSVLEDHLQVRLFTRDGRGLQLTDAGQDYLLQIAPALESIGAATSATRQRSHREELRLSAPPSLIVNWLMPRLQGFMAAYPGFNLSLSDALVLDPKADVDLAIEYRFQPDPELTSVHLLGDDVVPVVSRSHAGQLTSIADLRGLTLIETKRRLLSWKGLLRDMPWIASQPFLEVNYTLQALEAARLGMGVALANQHNAQPMVRDGSLCIPFRFEDHQKPKAPGYWLTLPARRPIPARALHLRDWLLKK